MVKPIGCLRKLVYLLAVVCFLVLTITGFYPVLIKGEHISGYPMMVHATFAPVFAACLAALAVMWAARCRFEDGDCPLVKRVVRWLMGDKGPVEKPKGGCSVVRQKVLFWLLIVLALPLILSIVVSMFPLLGTHWQELLLAVHRYVAGAFVIVAIVHALFLLKYKAA